MAKENNNGYRIVVFTVTLTFIATLVSDKLKDKPWFSTIISGLVYCWEAVKYFFSYSISIWVILLSVLVVLILRRIFRRKSVNQQPDFLDYTSDKLKKWEWRWEWRFAGNKYVMENLRPYCPNCGTQMHYNSRYGGDPLYSSTKCPRCNSQIHGSSSEFEKIDQIETLILDNIERKRLANQQTNSTNS